MRPTTPCDPESESPSRLSRLRVVVVIFRAAIVVLFRATIQNALRKLRSTHYPKSRLAGVALADADLKLPAWSPSDSAPTVRPEFSDSALRPDRADERIIAADDDELHRLASGRVSDQALRTKARKNAKRRRTAELPAAKFVQVAHGRYVRVEDPVDVLNLPPEEDSLAKENTGVSQCARDAFPEPQIPGENSPEELTRNETDTQSVASEETLMPGEISVVAPNGQQNDSASGDRAQAPLS